MSTPEDRDWKAEYGELQAHCADLGAQLNALRRAQPAPEPVKAQMLAALQSVVAWLDAPDESAFSDAQLAEVRAAIAAATAQAQLDDDIAAPYGSWRFLKNLMEHSSWDGTLQLDDALANIDDFANASRAQAQPAAVPVAWDWLRGVMGGIPTREERIGGQRQQYVAKEAVMGWLAEGQSRAERAAQVPAVPAQPAAVPVAHLVALELERLAQDPPISGNTLAQTRVLMTAANVREFGLAGGAAAQVPAVPAPAVPLSAVAILDGFCIEPHRRQDVEWFHAGVRFAERAHGVAAAPHPQAEQPTGGAR